MMMMLLFVVCCGLVVADFTSDGSDGHKPNPRKTIKEDRSLNLSPRLTTSLPRALMHIAIYCTLYSLPSGGA